MLVELAQIDIELGNKEANLDKAIGIIEESTADLILFPELFTTGFDFNNLADLAEPLNGRTVERISDICGKRIVAGSIVEDSNRWLYNTFVLIDSTGVIGKYRKIHLFDREKHYLSAGDDISVIGTEFGRIALATCYDLRFPELFRKFMENNADIVLICANFPTLRKKHWEPLIKARAIENQFFVIACNRVGRDTVNEYFGRSIAVDPWGEVLTLGDEGEEILRCRIDWKMVREIRKGFPVLRDIQIR
ncbi:MAG TPA: carbon-nitrogen family hydrolase [Candidatus Altiarchaeales archaeon]|nr:carbon-nitrogen family hydrolase [Candidatus Altiarchaeales archaeon]